MRDDLGDVPRAVELSRLTIRNIKENLFWAFCYNTIGDTDSGGRALPGYRAAAEPDAGGLER